MNKKSKAMPKVEEMPLPIVRSEMADLFSHALFKVQEKVSPV